MNYKVFNWSSIVTGILTDQKIYLVWFIDLISGFNCRLLYISLYTNRLPGESTGTHTRAWNTRTGWTSGDGL